MVEAVLVSQSALDFDKVILWCQQALGISIADEADQKRLKGIEKFQSCLNALGVDATKYLHFSVQFIGDEEDVLEALQVMGMPFIAKPTLKRGITYCYVAGTLDQWRDAVIEGCKRESTRELFSKIMSQFEAIGINPWQHFEKRYIGKTFRLEHKRA